MKKNFPAFKSIIFILLLAFLNTCSSSEDDGYVGNPPRLDIFGGATILNLNGEHIYTMLSAQPKNKPESDNPPSAYYPFRLVTTALGSPSMIAHSYSDITVSGSYAKSSSMQASYSGQAGMDEKMRRKENELLSSGHIQLSKKTAYIFKAAAPKPISVGTVWDNINIVDTGNTITATCQYISDHAYLFVDNRDTVADYSSSFDDIYHVNQSKFGTVNDVDTNTKILIVFSRELSGGVLGYFYPGDKFSKTIVSDSNEGDIIYLTAENAYQGDYVKGAMAHELQHMTYFDQHYNRGVTVTYTWLNEALSQAAEYYNNYLTNHEAWMRNFLLGDWLGLSLTHWTSDNYGYGAIFIRYLIDRFGDLAIYNMCSTNKVGIAAVEVATSTDFNTIFNDFSIALVLDGTGESADPRYNFSTLDLPAIQTTGRDGLETSYSYISGTTVSSSGGIPPYMITFFRWTGSFGSMNLTGTDMVATAFGLTE